MCPDTGGVHPLDKKEITPVGNLQSGENRWQYPWIQRNDEERNLNTGG